MTNLLSAVEDYRAQLKELEDQKAAEKLFTELLVAHGFREAEEVEYRDFESALLDPLTANYPRADKASSWFAHRPYPGGPSFALNLCGSVVPFELQLTRTRRNPRWHGRIIPSIGVCLAGELETGDSTLFSCGSYTSRQEKRELKALQEEHELFVKKLAVQAGKQLLASTALFIFSDEELLYEAPLRAAREQEALRLLEHLQGAQ